MDLYTGFGYSKCSKEQFESTFANLHDKECTLEAGEVHDIRMTDAADITVVEGDVVMITPWGRIDGLIYQGQHIVVTET